MKLMHLPLHAHTPAHTSTESLYLVPHPSLPFPEADGPEGSAQGCPAEPAQHLLSWEVPQVTDPAQCDIRLSQ